jgi:hypothetical protein
MEDHGRHGELAGKMVDLSMQNGGSTHDIKKWWIYGMQS